MSRWDAFTDAEIDCLAASVDSADEFAGDWDLHEALHVELLQERERRQAEREQ